MDMNRVRSRPVGENAPERVTSSEKRTGGAKGEVSERDAKRMHSALSESDKTAEGIKVSPGTINALFGQAMGVLTGQATGGESAPVVQSLTAPAIEAASAHCGELVDRILASAPSADGSTEVRITIDKPWLPATEVRLTLLADARLEVDFRTDSVEAQRFLLPNLDGLRERLAERYDDGVTVRMTESSREGGGDGRSRNRREVLEEYDGE